MIASRGMGDINPAKIPDKKKRSKLGKRKTVRGSK